MASNSCIECGTPIKKGSRCKLHKLASRSDPEYVRNRAIVLNAWIRDHGYICPGLPSMNHHAHPCDNKNPLTADHIVSLANGGSHQIDNLRPLCREFNSKRGRGWPTLGV